MINNTLLRMMIGGGIVYTAGDWFIKKWALSSDIRYLIPGFILWIIGLCFLANEFKYDNMAVASMYIVIFNMLSLVLMSWLCFDEPLKTTQLVGFFFGIIAVVFMNK